jgi:hypothetical protein
MEWPWKQFELFKWPEPASPDEINEKLRKAAERGKKKGEDLVSKEETTEALEGEGTKEVKILSPEKNAEKAKELVEKLERGELGKDKKE